jgi:hypothetical protein
MLLTFSPFDPVEVVPVPVVKTDAGTIYFAKKGSIDPNTMPISLQEQQDKQVMLGMLLLDAAEELAKKEGISVEDANARFLPRRVGNVVVPGISALPYLIGDKREQYFKAARESASLPVKVATLMIQHRMLFSVELTEPAKAKAKQLSIHQTWFELPIGTQLKFGGQVVTVTEPYDSGMIGITPLSLPLEAGAVGFVMKDSKRYLTGYQSWTEEQTRSLSIENADGSPSQIDLIYQFYLEESGRAALQPDAEEPEGNELPPSDEPSMSESLDQESTGTNSIGESNPTELTTNGSTVRTLETAPVG